MKVQLRVITVSITAFLLVLLFTITRSTSVTDLENAYLVQHDEQRVQDRTWREIDFIQTGLTEEFIPAGSLRLEQDGFIYTSDSDQMVVKQYDTQANHVATFGLGEGSGPGEFSGIGSLSLDPETGELWVWDPRNNRVTIFDPDDKEEWEILHLPEVATSIYPVGDGMYWHRSVTTYNALWTKLTTSGEVIATVEPIVDDPRLWFLVLDLKIAIAPDGSIVGVHWHTNTLLKYSPQGEVQFFRQPVSPPSLPRILPYYATEDPNRVNSVDFATWEQISKVPQIVGNTFHVYVHFVDKDSDRWPAEWHPGFMDVYDLEDGNYLYSYRLPDWLHGTAVAVSETHVAGLIRESGQLAVWEVNGGW